MREKGIEIIDIDYGIKQVIESELTKLPEEFTVLIIVKPNNYEKVVLGFMDILLNEKKLFGTYITTNKPFRKILENFLKNGIKAENLFFFVLAFKAAVDFNDSLAARFQIAEPPGIARERFWFGIREDKTKTIFRFEQQIFNDIRRIRSQSNRQFKRQAGRDFRRSFNCDRDWRRA